jgi:hypothetical protein
MRELRYELVGGLPEFQAAEPNHRPPKPVDAVGPSRISRRRPLLRVASASLRDCSTRVALHRRVQTPTRGKSHDRHFGSHRRDH